MANLDSSSGSRDQWGGKLGFIMATAGAAVGLGNLWRFPYVCGANGGGAFIIAYILCIIFISSPVLIAELVIGRAAGTGSGGAFTKLLSQAKTSGFWKFVGTAGVVISFLLVSYYSIIAGWTVEYLAQTLMGNFSDFSGENSASFFKEFTSSASRQIFWHIFLTLGTALILIKGISSGIEKLSKILMPLLLVILVIMAIYGLNYEFSHMDENTTITSLKFLFEPDWSKFTFDSFFQALGQAAFSLSIAVGTLIAYGSYLSKDENIVELSSYVIFMDTAVALLGGLVIFPVVFASGLNPSLGTGLIFVTLPNLFAGLDNGAILAFALFLLIFFAALTSLISLLEPSITHLVDEFKLSRTKACILVASSSSILGVVWVLTKSLDQNLLFLNVDKIVSNVLIPLEAIFISVFIGWVLNKSISKSELKDQGNWFFNMWFFALKWISPIAVTLILVKGLISQDMGG
jgi:NSS family neurotransmitter:Na+ symporter